MLQAPDPEEIARAAAASQADSRAGLGFKGLGFKGLGFKGLGFKGLGFKGLGFKGLRV